MTAYLYRNTRKNNPKEDMSLTTTAATYYNQKLSNQVTVTVNAVVSCSFYHKHCNKKQTLYQVIATYYCCIN